MRTKILRQQKIIFIFLKILKFLFLIYGLVTYKPVYKFKAAAKAEQCASKKWEKIKEKTYENKLRKQKTKT